MKVHYPKLYNMAHLLSLNVFTASKGSNNYILLIITIRGLGFKFVDFLCKRSNVCHTEIKMLLCENTFVYLSYKV